MKNSNQPDELGIGKGYPSERPGVYGKLHTEEEIKFLCTRFAHECRLKGVTTNDDTCKLFDKWIQGNRT